MSLSVALQIDPLSGLNPASDTSLLLGREALRRGHQLFYLPPESVSLREGEVTGDLAPLALYDVDATPFYALGEAKRTSLATLDVVLIRQNPPFDMRYITNCLLLERLQKNGTQVWNRPASIRNFPEKLIPLEFPQFLPPTLISLDLPAIREFQRNHGEVVVKPLYGFGGKSVFKIGKQGENLEALLEMLLEMKEPLVIQKFLPQVSSEEKRVVLVDGKLAGAIGRIPSGGDIRANMRVGGTATPTELHTREMDIVEAVGQFAKAQGFMLAGLDLIGDFLIEVNVTSPTALMPLKSFYGTSPEAQFWDAVEKYR